MRSKVSKNRVIKISGLYDNGCIKELPITCIRKNFLRSKFNAREQRAAVKFLRSQEVLGMVSHPTFPRSRTAPYVDGWCHCFRDLSFLPPNKPKLLLSESDFVDPTFIDIVPDRQIKYDFFCFILGGHKQRKRKGVDLLIQSLPIICGKLNLSIIIINYSLKSISLSISEKKILNNYKKNITYINRKLSSLEVAKLMSKCRFGFFPNFQDCSPLLLAESLVRNKPCMVNENIYGGWKYINSNTGVLFVYNNLEDKCKELLDSKYNPKQFFIEYYGFNNSAKKLAEWGEKNLKAFSGVKKACFAGLARFLRK